MLKHSKYKLNQKTDLPVNAFVFRCEKTELLFGLAESNTELSFCKRQLEISALTTVLLWRNPVEKCTFTRFGEIHVSITKISYSSKTKTFLSLNWYSSLQNG